MSRHLPPLHALQAFEAIARTRSVTGAANELNLTPSAVSHRLRNLESSLGISLFHRVQRRMVLSDAGRDYLQLISSALDRIERASERLIGGMASDILTVHCPPSFAPAWLVPRVHRFLRLHPDIDLRIHASPVPVDFFRTDTDVEIRSGNTDWAGLHVTPLMADVLTPLCAPRLRDRIGAEPGPEALLKVPLIFSERSPLGWEQWFRARKIRFQSQRGLRFDRGYLALQAAAAGLGVALESVTFAGQYLENGGLVRLFPRDVGDTVAGAHTLVYPPVYGDMQKVRLFREWIIGESADQ